jgi:mycofactocin system creatininase family protein
VSSGNELACATWPEVRDRPLVLVPVGSVEQHGPHLPLDTDTVIAEATAGRVARLLGDGNVRVAPGLAYGASGEHQMFPGTSSIGTEGLRCIVVELVRSMTTWAGRVVLVNGHGGNIPALTGAVTQLVGEGRDAAWVPCATTEADAHAGYTETSLMLHLRPWAVRLDRAEAGNTAPISELWAELVRHGVGAVSRNGVLGDPAGAGAEEGRRCLEAMAHGIVALVRDGRVDERGMLIVQREAASSRSAARGKAPW